jgi:hypothetical protein
MPLLPVHIRPFQIRPKFDDQSMVEFRGSSVTKTEAVANVSVVIAWSAAPSREALNKQAVQITTLIARHSLHRLLAPSILINHQSFIIHIHYITSSLITNHSSFITLSLGLCWLTLAALRFEPTPQFTPCGTSEGQVITPSLTYSLTFKWEVRSGCIYIYIDYPDGSKCPLLLQNASISSLHMSLALHFFLHCGGRLPHCEAHMATHHGPHLGAHPSPHLPVCPHTLSHSSPLP